MIIDQSGHPVEYSPAKYTYQEGLSCKKWKLINEEPIELSRWINRKEDIPALIEEKGQERNSQIAGWDCQKNVF